MGDDLDEGKKDGVIDETQNEENEEGQDALREEVSGRSGVEYPSFLSPCGCEDTTQGRAQEVKQEKFTTIVMDGAECKWNFLWKG